jgi:hypothetical protein
MSQLRMESEELYKGEFKLAKSWKKPGFKKKTSPEGFFGFFWVFLVFFLGFLGSIPPPTLSWGRNGV